MVNIWHDPSVLLLTVLQREHGAFSRARGFARISGWE